MNRAVRSGRALLLAPLLAVVLATGCTGDDPPGDPQSTPSQEGEAGPRSVKAKATLGSISGKLTKQRRRPLKRKVTDVVDSWVESAYLGDYPRTDFGDAFSQFTPLARRKAKAVSGLMSNRQLGEKVESVVATQRRYRIDALAVDNRPAGVTVRFALGLKLTGDVDRKDRVTGRLYIGKEKKKWRVFGFEVERRKRK